MFTDTNALQKLSSQLKKTDKTLWGKIKSFFGEWIAKLKTAYAGMSPDSELAKIARDALKNAESLQQLWVDAAVEAAKNYRQAPEGQKNNTAGGDVLHSIRDDIVGDSGKHYGSGVYLDTDLYEKNNSKKRWVTLKSHLRAIGNSGQKFTATDVDGNTHDIGVVPNKKFKNENGDMVAANMHLLGFLKNDTKQEILALVDEAISTARFERKEDSKKSHGWLDNDGKNKWEYWSVIVQDKNNSIYRATLQIANTEDREKLVYEAYPIEELEHGLKRSTSPVKDTITHPTDSVNLKSTRDSDGNSLSKAQQEYFKDSKVRDEDGNLRVVYHGTDADFTVFDPTKSRANMDIQGMFFSPWDMDAGGYGGNVKAYYLDIKNPASESMGYKALNLYKGQNEAGM